MAGGKTKYIRTPSGIIRYDNNFDDDQVHMLELAILGIRGEAEDPSKIDTEDNYHHDKFIITKKCIGLELAENTADKDKNVATARTLATARNITVGLTTKSFNGGSDISYTLAEIGALPAAGGVLTGDVTRTNIGSGNIGLNLSATTNNNSTGIKLSNLGTGIYITQNSSGYGINMEPGVNGIGININKSGGNYPAIQINNDSSTNGIILNTSGEIKANGNYVVNGGAVYDYCTNTYLPLSGGTITGDLTINGSATLKSTLDVTGVVVLNNNLSVSGTTTLKSTLSVDGSVTLKSGGTIKNTITMQVDDTHNISGSNYFLNIYASPKMEPSPSSSEKYNGIKINTDIYCTGIVIDCNSSPSYGIQINGKSGYTPLIKLNPYKGSTNNPSIYIYNDTVTNGISLNKSGEIKANGNYVVNGGAVYDYCTSTLKEDILNKVYPVGSIYMSVNSTNPSELFGGTWEAWGTGRVPVGINTSDTNFNTVEKTGGYKSHKHDSKIITFDQYNGVLTSVRYKGGSSQILTDYTKDYVDVHVTNAMPPDSSTSGSTQNVWKCDVDLTAGYTENNSVQPYITCYMWKRTA